MMKKLSLLLFCITVFVAGVAGGAVEVHRFETEAQQQQYKKLIDELRCLVCQNQNLADSNAELAQDLRNKVAEMIYAGQSETEIVDYMVARYGDFVLYRPPFKLQTMLLWLGPFVLMLAGFIVLVKIVRRQKQRPDNVSSDELDKARRLLDNDEEMK